MNGRRLRGRFLGTLLLAASIIAFISYSYIIFATSYSLIVLKATIVVAVGALLAVMAWIGYTMTTAPGQGNNEDHR
jgi:hypothetical protein